MNDTHNKIHVHIIDIKSGTHLVRPLVNHLPRIGDELRLQVQGESYWSVKCVVWCLDEDSPYTRVNIGVERIE